MRIHFTPASALLAAAFATNLRPPEGTSPARTVDPGPGNYPEFEEQYFTTWLGRRNTTPEQLRAMYVDARAVPAERDAPPSGADPADPAAVGWTSLGPYGMVKAPNVAKFTGRIIDLQPTPTGVLIGSASGGLWTFLFGIPVELTAQVSSPRIGSFTLDPNDGTRVLIGTGEGMKTGVSG